MSDAPLAASVTSSSPATDPVDAAVPDRRRRPQLSVITPTYCEAENVVPLLEALDAALTGIVYEVLVVDDDSPDGTWRVAEEYAERDPRVRVIRRFNTPGLSQAVMAGMAAAHGEVLAVIDADLQHDERILPQMMRTIVDGDADVVVGTRSGDDGSYGDFSPARRVISWFAALLARLFLRVPVSDPMSGYFALSRSTFNTYGPRVNPQGFKILLEFIGRRSPLRVTEIGYHFRSRQRGETKLSPSVIRSYLLAVFELWLGRQVKGQFFLYALVGLSGVFVNLAVFGLGEAMGWGAIDLGFSEDVRWSLLAGIQASVLSNFLLNNYFTFWERRFRGRQVIWGFLLFEIVSLAGVVIHVSVFQFLDANGWGSDLLGDEAARLVHDLLGYSLALVSNYFLNVNYTWQRRAVS